MRRLHTDIVAKALTVCLIAVLVGCGEDTENEFDGIPDPRGMGCESLNSRELGRIVNSSANLKCADYSPDVANYVMGAAAEAQRSREVPIEFAGSTCRSVRTEVEFPVLFPGDSDFTMCRGETESIFGSIDRDAYVLEYIMHTDASDPCWTESCTWRRRSLFDADKTIILHSGP